MSESPEVIEQLDREIRAYQHAVQTGIVIVNDLADQRGECSPKHLRVGVNSALIDSSAVVKVLVEKGIITHIEFLQKAREKTGLPELDLG